MATARLVFETSENLDSRTIAHRKPEEQPHRLVLTDDTIFSVSESGITARGLDLEVKWQAAHPEHIWTLEVVGDELFALDSEGVTIWSLAGEQLRRFERNTDWDLSDFAIDHVTGQVAMFGLESEEAWAAIFDGKTGEKLHEWDMAEDYDFGDWAEISGAMFHDGRLVLAIRQQLTVWLDGELEQCEWRRGKNLGQYSDESWFHTGEHIVEITSEKRGLVVFDAQSLELVAQPGAHGVFGAQLGGKTFCWSDQHVTIWDGEGLRFLKPDWRGHYLPSLTPDGRHAVSVSVLGELCVQRVEDFGDLDAEPEPEWGMSSVTAFATNPAGTHACIVRSLTDGTSRADVVDLETGAHRELGEIPATEKLHFTSNSEVFTTTGRWVNPAVMSKWSIESGAVTSVEVAEAFLGSGLGWMATKNDEGAVTFWTLEADAAVVLDRPELPDGLDLQELASRRYATGWDDDYEQIVYDFETQSTFRSDDGELGGSLYVVNDWSEKQLVVYELPLGKEIGGCENDDVGAVVVLNSRPHIFFTTYDGGLTTWQPPEDPVEVYSAEDLGELRKSPDDKYLVTHGATTRVFDTTSVDKPILELAAAAPTTRAEVSGELLLTAGFHGTYAVYRIER